MGFGVKPMLEKRYSDGKDEKTGLSIILLEKTVSLKETSLKDWILFYSIFRCRGAILHLYSYHAIGSWRHVPKDNILIICLGIGPRSKMVILWIEFLPWKTEHRGFLVGWDPYHCLWDDHWGYAKYDQSGKRLVGK